MSVLRDRAAHPAARSAAAGTARRVGRVPVSDLLAVAGLVAGAGMIEFLLRHLLTRHFYYDEATRAYDISLGSGFLSQPHQAAAPLALGWVGIENVARLLLGDTEAGLRAPMFLALPLLAVATYLLARRWLGVGVSFCTAGLLLVNTWIVNYALQLKSYSYEGLLAIAAVALYLLVRRTSWHPAKLLGLYAALGLTCVFSLPNLFVVGPLLVLDLAEALRARHRVALRIGGEAVAAAIALAHYLLFVSPQAGVAGTAFFRSQYAPHRLVAFVRFTVRGFESYIPGAITGVAGGARNDGTPSYSLPPLAHHLLALALVVVLAAGVVAAVQDSAARALVVASGGALVLELVASTLRRWPFGLVRVNIFVLPLVYVLGGIGAVWLGRLLRGRRQGGSRQRAPVAWLRAAALGVTVVVLAVAGAAATVATAEAFAETGRLQAAPTMFGGVVAAVADARLTAAPSDLVIIRADRAHPGWYAGPWLYYMGKYQGYPAEVAARPRIPPRSTLSVVYVTPGAVHRFLTAHPASPAVFLLEYNLPGFRFPGWAHQQSLTTLRGFGYCPIRETSYPETGRLTVLVRAGCPRPRTAR